MIFKAKLHNYPIRWTIEADTVEEARKKAWKVILEDMCLNSAHDGGFLELIDEKGERF